MTQKEKTACRAHCLCSAVALVAENISSEIAACHCGMCRRWGGGPFMEVSAGTAVVIEGEEFVSVFDSSEWAERGFCKQCGSHLFYRLKGTGEMQIPVGLLDDDSGLEFTEQVFIDLKPPYYRFADITNELSAAQVFEKYVGPD